MSPGDTGLELLENAVATGAALAAVIVALGSVSGAHLNPVVSLVVRLLGGLRTADLAAYAVAQVAGAATGAVVANAMYALSPVTVSTHARATGSTVLAEVVATFGLVLVVLGASRRAGSLAAPLAVAAYITAAYFFTSSTSFANPAVTLGRTLTDTFSGIAPSSVPAFVGAQLLGAGLALGAGLLLFPRPEAAAAAAVVPHPPASATPE